MECSREADVVAEKVKEGQASHAQLRAQIARLTSSAARVRTLSAKGDDEKQSNGGIGSERREIGKNRDSLLGLALVVFVGCTTSPFGEVVFMFLFMHFTFMTDLSFFLFLLSAPAFPLPL